MSGINKSRLFVASCFALITTAFAFGIRAGIMNDLVKDMSLTDTQLGWLNFMGIVGFPVATLVGGPLYNSLGPKKLGWVAFISHFLGITFSILSESFYPLFFSTFFISFGNGMVEAAYNPMISDMYEENKASMLNKFHVWFPGGIAIGSLIAMGIANMDGSWQMKLAVMYIPLIIYGFLFFGQQFPKTANEMDKASTGSNIKAMFASPLYWMMVVCMVLTATTELGTQGWVERILGNSGAQPLVILFMVTGLMAVGRFFAGPIIHKLSIPGVLLGSAVIALIGIYMMSTATGGMVYLAAILFAIGVCYFWPNMISFIAVYIPKTGALGMSFIGGMGMFGLSICQPIIGKWMDTERANALASGLTGDAAELAAGQATLDNIAWFPAILVIVFGVLFVMRKKWLTPEEGVAH
ncbi:MAG TPA: MFS transporter [Saprospiraceae bacterium]|nr:MFS transporter [Saprospiraceae bacterium]